MPTVYTFSRTDNEIKEALLKVFSASSGTAREQWSLQAEHLVEPVGWDALWKLSKQFCKKFEVRFPCVAYVAVSSVDFENLSACVEVCSVQHEAVSLPEMVEDVPLIELWPTMKQREDSINAATTAECIDLMRFFYNNIWMPWDDQDGKELLSDTIEDRMTLWNEIQYGKVPKSLARTITVIRMNCIDANDKLQELDSSLCENEMADEDDSLLPANYISHCAEMHVRLDGLMSKWTLYENRIIRQHFINAHEKKAKNRKGKNVVALWQGGSVFDLDEITKFLRSQLTNEHSLTMLVSAEEGLALDPEEVVVCTNQYDIPDMPLSNISICSFKGATLKASDMRSRLFMLSEDCRLRDLTLDCALVNTVVVMKAGTLLISRCHLKDDSKNSQSDFAQGVVAQSGAKILIEDCTFDNFYSGIVVHRGAHVELRNCTIKRCGVGIQMCSDSQVILNNTKISECSEQSIRCEVDNSGAEKITKMEGLQVMSNCNVGSGDLQQEIVFIQQDYNMQ